MLYVHGNELSYQIHPKCTHNLLCTHMYTHTHTAKSVFLQKIISTRDGPAKMTDKQGRNENIQEHYPTTKQWWKSKAARLPDICCIQCGKERQEAYPESAAYVR